MDRAKFNTWFQDALDDDWPGRFEWRRKLDERFEGFEFRLKRLEQFHCEHEFKNKDRGCLASIFCSECGVLHPDWKQTFPHIFGFGEGEKPVDYIIIGTKHYRTKASKPAAKKRK